MVGIFAINLYAESARFDAWFYVCMYVCTFVCMYVCMYVCECMYVRMYVCIESDSVFSDWLRKWYVIHAYLFVYISLIHISLWHTSLSYIHTCIHTYIHTHIQSITYLTDIQTVVIEWGKCANHTHHNRHWMCIAFKAVIELNELLMYLCEWVSEGVSEWRVS